MHTTPLPYSDPFNYLSRHHALCVRQAIADQRHSPQDDNGSITEAINEAIDKGVWAEQQ